MANQIIKQPNGLYAVWSSVVDDFTLVDCTPKEIIEEWVAKERERIAAAVAGIVEQLDSGGQPYHQFTMTFDEAVSDIRERHGDDAESLKLLGIAK